MTYKKGQKKTGGRKKGTPNKVTRQAKDLALALIANSFDEAQDTLKEMFQGSPKAREKALEYVLKLLPRELNIESEDLKEAASLILKRYEHPDTPKKVLDGDLS